MDICSYTYFFFPDVNNFIVGSEEGTVYTGTLIPLFSIYIALLCGYFEKQQKYGLISACRHGSRAGILDSFEGHAAPVTGLSTHNGQGIIDFSHLFLTCKFTYFLKATSSSHFFRVHVVVVHVMTFFFFTIVLSDINLLQIFTKFLKILFHWLSLAQIGSN